MHSTGWRRLSLTSAVGDNEGPGGGDKDNLQLGKVAHLKIVSSVNSKFEIVEIKFFSSKVKRACFAPPKKHVLPIILDVRQVARGNAKIAFHAIARPRQVRAIASQRADRFSRS